MKFLYASVNCKHVKDEFKLNGLHWDSSERPGARRQYDIANISLSKRESELKGIKDF